MKKYLLFLVLLMQACVCGGSQPQLTHLDPIHEAFISRIGDPMPLEVVPRKAPLPITETPPESPNQQAVWTPGYWAWSRDKENFTWVCGVWRVPPPERIWSTGFWKKITEKEEKGVSESFVWIQGVWMPDPAKTPWISTSTPPPVSQNENGGTPPKADYFWLPGYWNYVQTNKSFNWLKGSWHKFDSKMVLEPGHWVVREKDYLFVPTYWDFALEARGVAYDCMSQKPLDLQAIALRMTSDYPDYIPECHHCYYYHPELWASCHCVPIWWNWTDWWALPGIDQWWLWWWWLNPDYPYPPFLSSELIEAIPPAPEKLVNAFKPPIFVTSFGIPTNWLEVINQVYPPKDFLPLFPSNFDVRKISKYIPKTGVKKPGGKLGERKPGDNKHPAKPESTLPLIPPVGFAAVPPCLKCSHPMSPPEPSSPLSSSYPVPSSLPPSESPSKVAPVPPRPF